MLCEVFAYALKIDYVDISFSVFRRFGGVLYGADRLIEPIVSSFTTSNNYLQEKLFFLTLYLDKIQFWQAQALLDIFD